MDTMHELIAIDLSHNRIEGGLPFWSEWTSKSHKFLDYIDFSYNELDSNLREWTALFDGRNLDLRLNYNKIPTGYVPDIYLNYHSWPQMSMAIARQRQRHGVYGRCTTARFPLRRPDNGPDTPGTGYLQGQLHDHAAVVGPPAGEIRPFRRNHGATTA